MQQLTVEQIEAARVHILENAVELVDEAKLLFDNLHYARTFTLARLAVEELSKLPMIVRAGCDVASGEKVDWNMLRKRMQSHVTKINMAHVLDYALSDIRPDNSDVEALKQAYENSPRLNELKNRSLYTSMVDGDMVKPSESISLELAEKALDDARKRAEFYEVAESHTLGQIATYADSGRWKRLRDTFDALDDDK